jgi:hypothetical protein
VNQARTLRPSPTLYPRPATPPSPPLPDLRSVPAHRRERMLRAGEELLECYRVLRKGGLNIVGEVLKGQGQFIELEHYPRNDVYDQDSGAQYYYHAHRGPVEHGHFHTFLRASGMPAGSEPLDYPLRSVPWPQGEEALSHLIAISMDAWGHPVGLFAVNRWVTAEAWYPAGQVIEMLERFVIDHAYPSWPTNRWITAMFVLFRPEIEALVRHRDAVIEAWQAAHPGEDVLEDRALEITGSLPISVEGSLGRLREACSTTSALQR